MARGIFRTPDGRVQVDYGANSVSISRARYEGQGYEPPFDELPLEVFYRAAQKKPPKDA
jgi:hypothetical protein